MYILKNFLRICLKRKIYSWATKYIHLLKSKIFINNMLYKRYFNLKIAQTYQKYFTLDII